MSPATTVTTSTTSRARAGRRPSRGAAIGLGVFSALHGLAHFVGVTGHLEDASDGVAAEYLGGLWTIGDSGVQRVLAAIWAVVGTAFVVVGVLVALRHRSARRWFVTVAAVSLVLTVLASWESVVGVVVNVALLALATVPAAADRCLADDH